MSKTTITDPSYHPPERMNGKQINEALDSGAVVETWRVGINKWLPLHSDANRIMWPAHLELTARIQKPEVGQDGPSASGLPASIWTWSTQSLPPWLKQSRPLRIVSDLIPNSSEFS